MANGNLYLGIFLLVIGLVSLVGKVFKIKKMFWKLESFEKNYGEKWGNILHTISYVVIPIVAGLILIWLNL